MGEWFAGVCADLADGLPSTVPALDAIYDAASLTPTGYWVLWGVHL